MRGGELDHLAGADEQEPLRADRRKDPLGELHRRGSHRDGRAADVGLRADVLGDGERALEKAVQHKPQRSGGFGIAHRLLHLAQDLRLAQHHRVEAGRHPERVRHRLFARQREKIGRQRILGHVVEAFEPADDGLRLRPMHVDLGAVAGRQDRRFLDRRQPQKVAERMPERVRRERDPLAHLERRSRVVEAEGVEGHKAVSQGGESRWATAF